uniref:Uncharacterized protein n=1 Tax=Monilinia fructicola TaxID=38448 RepID=A0A889XPP1_MONFR|nr:hypothetical protein KQ509_mgp03 [Monilinia fructicola]QRF72201.1 hypothetical protein [Monilinia fructicola]
MLQSSPTRLGCEEALNGKRIGVAINIWVPYLAEWLK